MYYCTQDEQVAYTNSLTAEIAMNNNGATYCEQLCSKSAAATVRDFK